MGDKIGGVPTELIKEYGTETEENIPQYGIVEWLANELVETRKEIFKLKPKYEDAVDRNDLLEKYVERLANIIKENPHHISKENVETAEKYYKNLIRT